MSEDDIAGMIEIATNSKVKNAISLSIVKHMLIPRATVSIKCVHLIFTCLRPSVHISIQIKTSLIRWLVIVFEFIRNGDEGGPEVMRRYYGLLFAYLKYEGTRQWICQLISLCHRRSFLKPWRVDYLLELLNNDRTSRQLQAVTYLYRELCPASLIGNLATPESVFRHPDMYLLATIHDIQSKSSSEYFRRNLSSEPLRKRKRMNKPLVNKYLYNVDRKLELTPTLSKFVDKLPKFPTDQQMGLVFQERGMLVRLLMCVNEPLMWERLNNWLLFVLQDIKYSEVSTMDMADRMLAFARYTKVGKYPLAKVSWD
jgi:hypothetical protein